MATDFTPLIKILSSLVSFESALKLTFAAGFALIALITLSPYLVEYHEGNYLCVFFGLGLGTTIANIIIKIYHSVVDKKSEKKEKEREKKNLDHELIMTKKKFELYLNHCDIHTLDLLMSACYSESVELTVLAGNNHDLIDEVERNENLISYGFLVPRVDINKHIRVVSINEHLSELVKKKWEDYIYNQCIKNAKRYGLNNIIKYFDPSNLVTESEPDKEITFWLQYDEKLCYSSFVYDKSNKNLKIKYKESLYAFERYYEKRLNKECDFINIPF